MRVDGKACAVGRIKACKPPMRMNGGPSSRNVASLTRVPTHSRTPERRAGARMVKIGRVHE
jgi:hypothetical protein